MQDEALIGGQRFADWRKGANMFHQYVAIINFLRSRANFVPPADREVTQRVSKGLTQHPLVQLDQQLKRLVRENEDAIIQRQPSGGRR
jgi:hypothetical protein